MPTGNLLFLVSVIDPCFYKTICSHFLPVDEPLALVVQFYGQRRKWSLVSPEGFSVLPVSDRFCYDVPLIAERSLPCVSPVQVYV